MRQEVNLKESFLINRWGRQQKIKPGDKVRLAPFKEKTFGNKIEDQGDFLSLMTEGLKSDGVYTINRIGQLPDDDTVIVYLDLGAGRVDGYYAEYLQAVDERKIKAVEFPLNDPNDVVRHLKTITNKECQTIDYACKAEEPVYEETHPCNEWIILPATTGKCKVTIEGEPREVKLNPEKVIVIPVPAGKRHSLMPLSGFSSYIILSEALN